MPKIINNVVHVPGVVTDPYTPKWFSSTFTGSGKGTGMLNNQLSFDMNRLHIQKVTKNLVISTVRLKSQHSLYRLSHGSSSTHITRSHKQQPSNLSFRCSQKYWINSFRIILNT